MAVSESPIQRLLIVSDAALADVNELPPLVRTLIDTAAEVYVVTPILPGRVAWLASELDQARDAAEERLDAVLRNMRAIGARASGVTGDEIALTAVEDAIATFHPHHILIALRNGEHANWQENGLIQEIGRRFRLPLTTYAVDQQARLDAP